MKKKRVKVYSPATIANVGPGFDVLGIAIDQPGDIVIAERVPEYGLLFSSEGSLVEVPTHTQNIAAHVATVMIKELNIEFGISLNLQKRMPIGSGLGSSAASSAAAAFAVNALLPEPLSKMDLIPFALEGERMASGTAHADNVAPSLLGGLCLIRSYNPLDIIEIPVRNNFFWVVAHPNVVVETKVAREILPTMIPLESMIRQSGNLAGLITGLISGDEKIIKHSLRDDVIEPVRSRLIPAFNEVKQAAIAAGALAFSISGSGPSVFAVARTQEIALRIGAEIKNTFNKAAFLSCDVYISKINMNGSTLLETEE